MKYTLGNDYEILKCVQYFFFAYIYIYIYIQLQLLFSTEIRKKKKKSQYILILNLYHTRCEHKSFNILH